MDINTAETNLDIRVFICSHGSTVIYYYSRDNLYEPYGRSTCLGYWILFYEKILPWHLRRFSPGRGSDKYVKNCLPSSV